jgi:YHS domain-containing protein
VATDPVCGMDVDDKKSSTKTEYDGRTYYFCSSECKREFQEDPESYTEEHAEQEEEIT